MIRVISYGGGVQSTALVVLAATGRITMDKALFANVGDKAEDPLTLNYVREVAIPWAAKHDFEVIELSKGVDLYDALVTPSRSIVIPVRMKNGAPGNRRCTFEWKVAVIARWLREHGATAADPAEVAIGFSTDEIHRVGRRKLSPIENLTYPLLDLEMDREDCAKLIEQTGLPVPPKSACWFCPFHRVGGWKEMRRERPHLFERAAELEATICSHRARLGKDDVFLSRYGKPLREAFPAEPSGPPEGIEETGCDEGYCFT